MIRISALCPSSQELATVARWRVEAFGDVLQRSIDEEHRSLVAFTGDRSRQLAVMARVDATPAGTCLLVPAELQPCHPVSPWLAGLYVAPDHRRRGVGEALVKAIEDAAWERGNTRLYLYTSSAVAFYERLAWAVIDRSDWQGHATCLMAREREIAP